MRTRGRTVIAALASLSLCIAVIGCNKREKECTAVSAVISNEESGALPSPADGGLALHVRTEQTIAALDALHVRDERLAPAVASYRALLVTRAQAARELETEVDGLLGLVRTDADAGPRLDLEQVKKDLEIVMRPLFVCAIAPEHSADASAECDALTDMLGRAAKPAAGATLSAHVLSCASMLDTLPARDPQVVAAARELAIMMRAYEPALRGVQIPATEVVSRAQRAVRASAGYQRATEAAKDGTKAIWAACSGV